MNVLGVSFLGGLVYSLERKPVILVKCGVVDFVVELTMSRVSEQEGEGFRRFWRRA